MSDTGNSADTPGKPSTVAALVAIVIACASLGLVGWKEWRRVSDGIDGLRMRVEAVEKAGTTQAKIERELPTSFPDFRAVAKAESKAVVQVIGKGRPAATGPADELGDLLKRFGLPKRAPPITPGASSGSGFITSQDGIIVTNAHVVDGATEITVKTPDRKEYKATMLGSDKTTDIAVLKIDTKDLPVVRWGDSDALEVGEWVVAIGAPFGFDYSVTAGIVSAKARILPGDSYAQFIQTDAAINPGNSGGPLFNLEGEVVGVNSQIISRSGGFQGLGFSIPANLARRIAGDLSSEGKVRRGKLGLSIQQVDQGLAESFGLDRPRGALVAGVEPGSPADKAGLVAGDIVLQFEGMPIEKNSDLPALVAVVKPGAEVKLDIWRAGKETTIKVVVGEFGPAPTSASSSKTLEFEAGPYGLSGRGLTEAERKSLNEAKGVYIEKSADSRIGIAPGDIVLSVDGKPVGSMAELEKALTEGKPHAVLVSANGKRRFVAVTP